MKKLVSTRKRERLANTSEHIANTHTREPFDYTKEYLNRKREHIANIREYEYALSKALEFDKNNPHFTGDWDDTIEGKRLWYAIRRLKGKF